VVRLAVDDDVVAVDADDGVDDAQVEALRLQPRALLDVKFQVAADRIDRG